MLFLQNLMNFIITKYLKQEVDDDLSVCMNELSHCGLSVTKGIKVYQCFFHSCLSLKNPPPPPPPLTPCPSQPILKCTLRLMFWNNMKVWFKCLLHFMLWRHCEKSQNSIWKILLPTQKDYWCCDWFSVKLWHDNSTSILSNNIWYL